MPVLDRKRDVLSVHQMSKEVLLKTLQLASTLKKNPQPHLLQGKIMGSCFFEPSTRTRLSFESAMYRLGGQVVGFSDTSTTSMKKGESLVDAMRVVSSYVDTIVLRHPLEGAAKCAAEAVSVPVINAGDGSNQHPTQTLLDLMTVQECHGQLDELTFALVGDLKHGRTAHSLALACAHFNPRIFLVSPPSLEIPKHILDSLRKQKVKYSCHRSLEEVLDKTDVLYMTRIQEERFTDPMEYQSLKNAFHLTASLLEQHAQEHLSVLHPLPRCSEIHTSVDATPYAQYFKQAANGLYVRQAVLAQVLGAL